MRFILLIFLVLSFADVVAQPFGYSYAKQITIQSSQVSGTANHSNFPVLISVTDANLRTTANGGHVTNNNGYDIIFTSSDCMTQLDHQVESYNPATGLYIAWVRVPVLSISANTVIQMYYGNSSVTTSTSSTGTWETGYKGVWHFNNSVLDNTSNASNLTDNATANLAAGKIGEGRDLNNSTNVVSSGAGQYLRLSNGFFAGMTNFSFEGWVYLDRSDTNWERIFDFGQGTVVNFFLCPSTGTGSPSETRARITNNNAANEQGPVSGNVTNTGAWVHWAVVLNNATSTMTLYKNGAVLATASGTVTRIPQDMEPSTANYFGRSQYAADHYIDAKFDEFRISSVARPAGWITTSYNNQNAPSSFYTIAAEVTAGTLCAPLPVTFHDIKAEVRQRNQVKITWSTATEINNDYFTIERSPTGMSWEAIGVVPGAGNSSQKLSYSFVDNNPYWNTSYYRIRQTDYDGARSYSSVVVATMNEDSGVYIYYQSDASALVVEWKDDKRINDISVVSILGQSVRLPSEQTSGKKVFNTSNLTPGIYIVRVRYAGRETTEKILIP
jgi:hypothetical protein